MSKRTRSVERLGMVHPNAAGLDIGAAEIWACVPPKADGECVRRYGTFTPDLHCLADWLVDCKKPFGKSKQRVSALNA